MSSFPAKDLDSLRAEIAAQHNNLSKRLQQIARFALHHPNDMALQPIAVIAEEAKVQPSALIRFAKAFGYSGFSEMKRVFQEHLSRQAPSYSERIRLFHEQNGSAAQPKVADVLQEFAAANILSLEHLQRNIAAQPLEEAIERLAQARHIHVVGMRRSFAVAAYLTYGFSQIGRNTRLLDGNGGMLFEQTSTIGSEDVLLAVSSQPYAPETAHVVKQAADKQIPVIVITDSTLSPIAPYATVYFEIHDAEVRAFRSLTTSFCLAQTLVVGLGIHLDGESNGTQVHCAHSFKAWPGDPRWALGRQ
ncbi:MAG: MurR/RpiR family transcriptional regulator [Candidatus Competibacteraceae bacterium]|nr:MurR/RpiR family transcriptional regulator [Candidatus Competibacteraceae bacterium]